LQKPVGSGYNLEMTTAGFSTTLGANHQTIQQHIPEHSNPFEIMLSEHLKTIFS
jgi:hypothetical protein